MKHTEISTIKGLANYLRSDVSFIENAINNEYVIVDSKLEQQTAKIDSNSVIVEKIYIKKKGKNSGFRIVYAVRTFRLADTLKILNTYLNEIFKPHASVHGFVRGKSILTNARLHLAKKTLLSVDIENYFESITKEMVKDALVKIGFSVQIADWISDLTTINGHLVQGFNTSPTIANIVTDQMDKDLKKICGKEIIYSRYADDLYFSTNNVLPEVTTIEKIISKYGFILNENKTKEMKRGRKQFVTGLTVFDDELPRIPKKIKKNIRLEIHWIKKVGYTKHAIRRLKNTGQHFSKKEFEFEVEQEIINTVHRLFGWIHFINSIEPVLGLKLHSNLIGSKR